MTSGGKIYCHCIIICIVLRLSVDLILALNARSDWSVGKLTCLTGDGLFWVQLVSSLRLAILKLPIMAISMLNEAQLSSCLLNPYAQRWNQFLEFCSSIIIMQGTQNLEVPMIAAGNQAQATNSFVFMDEKCMHHWTLWFRFLMGETSTKN